MTQEKGCIGVFDSGFGGLTILKEIVQKLPEYQYLYLGDTARTPYGSRSQETIYKFTQQAVDLLFSKGCELVILACNTASSEALRKLQQTYLPERYPDKKVLGVLIPTAEEAVTMTKNKRIGVLATPGTVGSEAFIREVQKLDPTIKVFQQAAPLLVPAIEAGEHTLPVMDLMLRYYLEPLLSEKIDTLILGCTHYSILSAQIINITGSNIQIISEGEIVAEKLEEYLQRHSEIKRKLVRKSGATFLTTDITEGFSQLGPELFNAPFIPKKIVLEE